MSVKSKVAGAAVAAAGVALALSIFEPTGSLDPLGFLRQQAKQDGTRPVELYAEWDPAKPSGAHVTATGPGVDKRPPKPPYHEIIQARKGQIIVLTVFTANGSRPHCEIIGPDGAHGRQQVDDLARNQCAATLVVA